MLTRDLGCGLPMRIIPKPSPTPGSVENLSSMKLVSGAKKVGERCIRCCSALCIGGGGRIIGQTLLIVEHYMPEIW